MKGVQCILVSLTWPCSLLSPTAGHFAGMSEAYRLAISGRWGIDRQKELRRSYENAAFVATWHPSLSLSMSWNPKTIDTSGDFAFML